MLTDLQCRKAKAGEKGYKLPDAKGLHLFVSPTGHKSWRMKYHFGEVEKLLTIGPYPEIGLEAAREHRDRHRKDLREGKDPAVVRKQRKAQAKIEAASTFEAVGKLWHANELETWSERHAKKVLQSLENHLFPSTIGKMPINEITPALALEVIRKIEARSIHIAKQMQRRMSAIFVWAIAGGIGQGDPAAIVKRAMKPLIAGQYPAVTDLEDLRALLRAAESQEAQPITRLAGRMLALTAVRPSMVRLMPRTELFDLDGPNPEWRIPSMRMKLSKKKKQRLELEFIVPLVPAAVATLKAAIALSGKSPLVFASPTNRAKPLSDATLAKYFRVAPFEGKHVPHGWRSSFSTIMNERAEIAERKEDRPIIDLMLAHLPSGVEAVYNRYMYMPTRRRIADEWAELLLDDARPLEQLLEPMPPRGVVRRQAQKRERPVTGRAPGRPRRQI